MIAPLALLALGLFPDRAFAPVEADVSDLTITGTIQGLTDVAQSIKARPDAECFESGWLVLSCFVEDRAQVYQMTQDGHPAHPAIFFRGYVSNTDARPTLEEKGWFAGDELQARAFFERGTTSMVQPEKPKR